MAPIIYDRHVYPGRPEEPPQRQVRSLLVTIAIVRTRRHSARLLSATTTSFPHLLYDSVIVGYQREHPLSPPSNQWYFRTRLIYDAPSWRDAFPETSAVPISEINSTSRGPRGLKDPRTLCARTDATPELKADCNAFLSMYKIRSARLTLN